MTTPRTPKETAPHEIIPRDAARFRRTLVRVLAMQVVALVLLWLLQLKNGEVKGRQTPVGVIPTEDELVLDGMDTKPEDLRRILSIDVPRWQQEMEFREEHLKQFDRLPEQIWEAHRRVADALAAETD